MKSDGNVCAGVSEREGDGAADAPRATGDKRDFAVDWAGRHRISVEG
jgi:hypothetical protein